jgi:hypothetical protein
MYVFNIQNTCLALAKWMEKHFSSVFKSMIGMEIFLGLSKLSIFSIVFWIEPLFGEFSSFWEWTGNKFITKLDQDGCTFVLAGAISQASDGKTTDCITLIYLE